MASYHIRFSNWSWKAFPCILVILLLNYTLLSIGNAHVGHDHGPVKKNKKTQSKASQQNSHLIRKSLNSLIISQDIQSHLKIKTELAAEQMVRGSIRLIGQVISDPSGYARLQATQNARVLNDPAIPFPLAGQKVKKDQILLAMLPTLSKVESTDQRLLLYKAESEIVQLMQEIDRKERLGEFASQKGLKDTRSELERAKKQKEEIINKTFTPEYLISPLEGIISDLHVRQGEVVTPEKTIVEIVDPTKLLVEAFVFDPILVDEITGGTAELPLHPGYSMPLKILGISPKVNKDDQSIHIVFKVEKTNPIIKLDMAVEVLADLKTNKSAIVIPYSAIIEDSKGSWVFVKAAPEVFEMKKVAVGPRVNKGIVIHHGINKEELVVIKGAYLLQQAMIEND